MRVLLMQIARHKSWEEHQSFHSCFSVSNANLITSTVSHSLKDLRSLVFLLAYLVHGEKLSKENGETFVLAHAPLGSCTGDHEILKDFGKRKFSVRHWYARSELCEQWKLSLACGYSHLFRASVKRESC